MRFRILLFAIIISISCFAQELSPIQNYAPNDYAAGNQNWAISQSQAKYMYIGNNEGLLEFNGNKWRLYPSPNNTIIRSVNVINDRIYTGCYMEFGYWEKDKYQNLSYHSLTQKLDEPLIEDEQFWNILPYKDWVLFQSLNRIYIFNTINENFEIIDSKSTRAKIFIIDDTIYFQKINEGIFKIEKATSVLVSDIQIFKDNIVVGAFPMHNEVVFLTEKGEFYRVIENTAISKWDIPADKLLEGVDVYSSLQLWDGSIILGTIANGFYHIDTEGAIVKKINQSRGLQNNTVLSVFEDEDNNIWLGLDNGISVINNIDPFKEYIDQNGNLGVVYTALLVDNYLYLGTNQGLFFKPVDKETPFQLIPNTKGQVWLLKQFKGTVFCGHNKGTFVVNGNKVNQISDFPGTWDLKEITGNENLLLQGNYEGISVLQKENGEWGFRNKIEGFSSSSRFIEFVDEHQIIVNHEYKGIFKLDLDLTFKRVLSIEEEASKGIGASLVNYNGDVIYATINGVYKYDKAKSDFIKDTFLTEGFFSVEDPTIGILTIDRSNNRLWGFSERNIVYASPGKLSGSPEVTKIPVPDLFRKNMGVSGFEFITNLKDQQYLIGINNGYVTLDLDKIQSYDYTVHINNVTSNYFEAEPRYLPLTANQVLDYEENNLIFTYCVPEFDKYLDVYYQYILEGYFDDWSTWSTKPDVIFNNLPYGEYTFKLQAMIGNTPASNVASYRFAISRPWYLSNLAIVLYIVIASLITLLIHQRYRSYYRKKHSKQLEEARKEQQEKKLRAELEIDQIRNEKLQNEIENKNRELAISTMSLIKKNEFLRTIKSQLKNIDSKQEVRSVIKSIDRNITNEDDWKFFEEAFNNADKDFLKKVKEVHSDLTPNDLKLCAYLRLNLSSKEIAPLLNISVRSVEVKRYRLRKKISLPHENSLSDYLLSL